MAIEDYYRKYIGSERLGGRFSAVRSGDFIRADIVKAMPLDDRGRFESAKKFVSLGFDKSFEGLEVIVISEPSSSSLSRARQAFSGVEFVVDAPDVYGEVCPFEHGTSEAPDAILKPSFERTASPVWVKQVFENKPWIGWSAEENEVVFPGVDPIDVPAPPVSVAVPVYNKPDRFMPFFRSLKECTIYPNLLNVVIVNDGSDEYSTSLLRELCAENENYVLVEQENSGYLLAANKAIDHGFYLGADYVVTCNTDLLVTHGWLSGMVRAAIRTNASLVNPLSNQQALISLPMTMEKSYGMRRFAGRVSYIDAAIAASFIPPSYPDAVTSIGNCLMIASSAWQGYGPFDEHVYGQGYGEECELWARIRSDGGKCVVADDVYVYHESHGTMDAAEEREAEGMSKFLERWRPLYNREMVKMRLWDKRMDRVRMTASSMMPHSMPVRFICFNIGNYGGVQCVVTLVNELIKRGFNASIEYVVKQNHSFKFQAGPNVHSNAASIVALANDESTEGGFIVATHWFTGELLQQIMDQTDDVIPLAFWQDREDLFIEPNGTFSLKKTSMEKYPKIPNRIVNAKWVGDSAKDELGISNFKHIPVGVDCNKFYPGEKRESKVKIVSMYRPSTPRRGAKRLESMIKKIKERYGEAVSVETFGEYCTFADVDHGKCSPDKVASIMRTASIVIEPSDFQGFGLPGLEGMASGCALVSTDNMGVHEYGIHSVNCFIANTDRDLLSHVYELIDNPELVERIGKQARERALEFDWQIISDRWAEHLNEIYKKSGFQKYSRDPLPF